MEATYTYDALGRRIGIDDNGTQTWTVYDGMSPDALPYADFNGSGTLLERYVHGPGVVNGAAVDELLARTSSGGSTAWYLTDKLGSVRDIVNLSGTVIDHVVYDSFGNIVTETSAINGDRFKYAGMEFDAVTGQFYDRARYYDPSLGRFMSQDPTGFVAGDPSLFRYASNSPSNLIDRTGLEAENGTQQGGSGLGSLNDDDRKQLLGLMNEYREQMLKMQELKKANADALRKFIEIYQAKQIYIVTSQELAARRPG